MKSTAQIKSHPLHPILVAFPIVTFTGTLFCDLVLLFGPRPWLQVTAGYLNIAAIITALVAAVPGAIDYFFTVPPKSSAKKRATQHALINITVVVLFIMSMIIRKQQPSTVWPAVIELAGVVLLSVAGWLGGTLVYRNQIGIDVRYANAGKWKEARFSRTGQKIKVAGVTELGLNQMKLLHINSMRIVLARTENGYVAFDDRCSHKGGTLAGGSMICGTVQCPWHGSQFDVYTGTVKAGPAKEQIQTYPVSEEQGNIFITVP